MWCLINNFTQSVIPAEAGIQYHCLWIPVCTGMTKEKSVKKCYKQDTNNMVVTHTRDEFILDFLMVAPPEGAVNARIIVSPGHMKRICEALKDNIARYEKNFGAIKIADEPKVVGFVETK